MSEPSRAPRAARAWPWPEALCLLARLIAGATFLYASLDKIAHPADFAQAVYNYRLAPVALLHPFALLLPWVEAVTGVALLLGVARRGAGWLAALMTVMFLVAVGVALGRGLDISCGCFDTRHGSAVGWNLFVRDLGLLLACAWPLALARRDAWTVPGLFRGGKRS